MDAENIFNAWVATRGFVTFTSIPLDEMAKQNKAERESVTVGETKEGFRSTGPISVALFQQRIF
jgi:hypothetical protein